MPSKFVSKAFVRDEICRAKSEILDKVQTFSQNLSFTETVDHDGSVDEVISLKDQLKGFSTALTVYDEKLSMLIEGSVRRVVQIEKGEEWVKGFTTRASTVHPPIVEMCHCCRVKNVDGQFCQTRRHRREGNYYTQISIQLPFFTEKQ
jgi:hypothetical protein